jgi:predicted DNA-binding protein
MAKKRAADKKMRNQAAGSVRASISFPPEVYESLEIIAKEKKVSLAWVVREAAELYIGDKWPLFSRKEREQQ